MKIIQFPTFKIYLGDPPDQFIPDEDRARWCEALRSGRYVQGCNYLRTDRNHYCCLGVQCELEGMQWSIEHYNGMWQAGGSTSLYKGRLPIGQRGIFPLNTYVQITKGAEPFRSLTVCNDYLMTFSEIADIIDTIWNPKSYDLTI